MRVRLPEGAERSLGLETEAEMQVEAGEIEDGLWVGRVELDDDPPPQCSDLLGHRRTVRPAGDVEGGVFEAYGPGLCLLRSVRVAAAGLVIDGARADLVMVEKRRNAVRTGVPRLGDVLIGHGGDIPGGDGRRALALARTLVGRVDLRDFGAQLDHALTRGALELAYQDLFGGGDGVALAFRPGDCALDRREERAVGATGGLRGVLVRHVEREIAAADEGGADTAVAAKRDLQHGCAADFGGGDGRDPRRRDALEDPRGVEPETTPRERQARAVARGLERPLGGRIDSQHEPGEALVLAAAHRAALRGERRAARHERGGDQRRAGLHAARLSLEARSAPSSSL